MNKQTDMLTAFRHAANSIGIEAGVVAHRVDPSEIEASVIGDTYYLELISEAELRLKKLSIKYEKLRAAAAPVLAAYDEELENIANEWGGDGITGSHKVADALREELGL